MLLTVFTRSSILDVCQDSHYLPASHTYLDNVCDSITAFQTNNKKITQKRTFFLRNLSPIKIAVKQIKTKPVGLHSAEVLLL